MGKNRLFSELVHRLICTLVPAFITVAATTSNIFSQVIIADFEQPKPGAASGYDSLTGAFPNPATAGVLSAPSNSNGTAGYVNNSNRNLGLMFIPPATPDGNSFIGLHSDARFTQEVVRLDLIPSHELQLGFTYNFSVLAHVGSLGGHSSLPPNVFDSPGFIDLFGIRTGSNPELDSDNQKNSASIAALPDVDLLGTFGIVTSSVSWNTFSFSVTAIDNYDRLLVVPRKQALPDPPYHDTFIFIDRLTFENIQSDLRVTKSADETSNVAAGQVINYTYVVTNTGDQTILNISISDVHNGSGTLPQPVHQSLTTDAPPTGDSPDNDAESDNTIWGTLAPGDAVTFTAPYTVTQSDVDNLQ